MNRRVASFALAALVVGGVAAAVVPQHAWSIARVAAVAVAVLAGAAVLAAVGAVTGRDPEITALDREPGGTAPPLDPHGLRDARRDLGRPTQSGVVPPPVWERLRVAALLAMAERGLDIDSPRTRLHARRLLSPVTWELLTTPPAPGGTPTPEVVASTVNRILDELDKIPDRSPPMTDQTTDDAADTEETQLETDEGPRRVSAAALAREIVEEVERAVVGKRDVIDLVLAAMLAGGHVLLEDLPGVAKTLLARSLATACGLDFARVQFTPDLLPSDITGTLVLDVATNSPVFRPGPVFCDVLLADEINRAPAKSQAALLEAMQEAHVTVDGVPRPLGAPFAVIATQNPIEAEGTYPLPEAQLDRFLVRIGVGYPSSEDELTILERRLQRATPDVEIQPVASRPLFLAMQQAVEQVHVDPRLLTYALELVRATRDEKDLAVGASPRGSLALVTLARAWALVRGRDYVGPDDIRALAIPTLAHRVTLDDDAWVRGIASDDVVRRVIDRIPAPNWS